MVTIGMPESIKGCKEMTTPHGLNLVVSFIVACVPSVEVPHVTKFLAIHSIIHK